MSKGKKEKATPWYSASAEPVRIGLYQCRCCGNMFWWNGENWQISEQDATATTLYKGWRGLRSPSK